MVKYRERIQKSNTCVTTALHDKDVTLETLKDEMSKLQTTYYLIR